MALDDRLLCYDEATMCAATPSGVEFRQHDRAPLEVPAEIRLDAFSDPLTGITANASLGGMFIKMQQPLPVGSLVQFRLRLDTSAGEEIRGSGEVVWIRVKGGGPDRPAGIGIQFRFIEGDGGALLKDAVRQALARLGPEPETRTPPAVRPPRPAPSPAPAERSAERSSGRSKPRAATEAPKPRTPPAPGKPAKDGRQILGIPAEKAKIILLLVLFAVLALVALF